MKHCILIIILGINISSWSQENKIENKQLRWYKEAIAEMNDSNKIKSMSSFFNVYNKDRKSELGKIALKKSDSLKVIVRKGILMEILGEWKLTSSGSNWGFKAIDKKVNIEKVIVIKENEILFFEQEKGSGNRKLLKTEPIIYYDKEEIFPSFIDFVFSDKQIWSYYPKDSNLLQITNTGEATENGRSYLVCGNSEMSYERIK